MNKQKYEAHIGYYQSFGSYINSYETAINFLFEKIDEIECPINMVSYPILFLMRHTLEISYKFNINYLAKYSKLSDCVDYKKHYLSELHLAFLKHYKSAALNLNIVGKFLDDFLTDESEAKQLIIIFNKIDRGSFSFRYPIKKNNDPVFNENDSINLLDAKKSFDLAMALLFKTNKILEKTIDYSKYFEEYFKTEIHESRELFLSGRI